MRFAKLLPVSETVGEMQQLYGEFDLGLDGTPNELWKARNLKKFRPPEMLEHVFFPGMFIAKVSVHRRILGPLGLVYEEIGVRWTMEARKAYGLNQFMKCYCFGDGAVPNLHWYGAAWELSPAVAGEVLAETIKIFTRHGFTYAGVSDRKRVRTFEYW